MAPKGMLNPVTATFELQTGDSKRVEANQSNTFWSCDWFLREHDKIKDTGGDDQVNASWANCLW